MLILKPIITERTLASQQQGKYSFWADLSASKSQIAAAFDQLFNLKPLKINTIVSKGKIKTDWRKHLPVVKSDRKKVIITVAKDAKLPLLNTESKK